MSAMIDLGVLRALAMLKVPVEAHEMMENWGRWQRSGTGLASRRSGIEGRNYRSNRCEICFEKTNPCDLCRYTKSSGSMIDERAALLVERAIHGRLVGNSVIAGFSDRDVALLLGHFRGIRGTSGEWRPSNTKALCRQLGINVSEYENTVSKLIQMTWNRVKQAKNA
ncbi:hypothetical protein [Chromobacterium haemolyticum]|nr:hypothetical protein [Chromobacterium haemolyticum]